MILLDKLRLVEYIYEKFEDNTFIYRKSIGDNFLIVNEKLETEVEYKDVESLAKDLSERNDLRIKVEILVDIVLTEQALYHKILMENSLKVLNLSISDLNIMEQELKTALKDITKKYVSNRLTIINGGDSKDETSI